jgi:class 3 adenylate cyclase
MDRPGAERKLAAIFAADVVGYSGLMRYLWGRVGVLSRPSIPSFHRM